MKYKKLLNGIFTGNQLKIFAMFAMTCDHAGKLLFPSLDFLRIIGRLAFPIFAYMIAEGCRYTKNRTKYLLTIAVLALISQIVYFFAAGSLYQCILVTFTLSIALTYVVDNALKKRSFLSVLYVALSLTAIYTVSVTIPNMLTTTDFHIDYGLGGILFPVLVFSVNSKWEKLALSALCLVMIALSMGGIQWYSLAALFPLALYGGERGTAKLKNLFYIYYPLHLVILYLIKSAL